MTLTGNYYLSVGDGATSDYLDFSIGSSSVFEVSYFDPGRPFSGQTRSGNRNVTLGLHITETSTTAIWNQLRAIETKLGQARQAVANPQGGHTGVTLGVKLGSSSNMVYFDVVDGSLTIPQGAFSSPLLEQGAMWFSGSGQGVILQLECLPYARGASQALSGSPFTINKAGNFTFYEASIPGDVPALVTYEITDNSSGVVLNKLLISHKSQPDLDSGDWDPVVDFAAGAGGTLTGSHTDAVDSDYAGDSSLLFSDGWSEVGVATPGTPYADQAGVYDVYGRVYDSLTVPKPPRNLAVGDFTTTGSMPAGNYTVVVTSIVSSAESAPSETLTFQIKSPMDRVTIDWDAPLIGTPTDYRVYYKVGTNDWKYQAVGAATTQLVLASEAGATTADPPSEPSVDASLFRGRASASSGTTKRTGESQLARISNAQWEPMRLFSGVHLPPIALEEGGSVEAWDIYLEAARNDPNTTPAVRVDAAWMLPSENVVEAEYLGLDLATARKWVIGRTRHGNPHGVLRNKSTDAEVGQISVSNPPVLGPGDTQVVFLPLVAGGVWNVSGISLSVAVTVTPRFSFLRGSI